MAISKSSFTKTVVKPWNKLSMEVVESSSLEGFQRDVEESCRDMV